MEILNLSNWKKLSKLTVFRGNVFKLGRRNTCSNLGQETLNYVLGHSTNSAGIPSNLAASRCIGNSKIMRKIQLRSGRLRPSSQGTHVPKMESRTTRRDHAKIFLSIGNFFWMWKIRTRIIHLARKFLLFSNHFSKQDTSNK
mgnify:CR=1 FL=1